MDGLTGVGNRSYYDATLIEEWSNAFVTSSPITLVMFDIDYFKKYNDTYGHLSGDICLQSIAQAINGLFSEDCGYTFCRYGGEEFSLILPSTNMAGGIKVAHLLHDTVEKLNILHKSSEVADIVTLSIGVATIVPTLYLKPETLIEAADSALYHSKTRGRNTISN